MKIYRWKHPTIKAHLWGIIQGFAELADACVTLGSLGFFGSGFEMEVARRRAFSMINSRKNQK